MTQDDTTLISIIADIRDKSGVGAKPMLGELADAIALVIDQAYERGQESMRERAAQVAKVVAGRQPNSMGMTGYEAGSAKAANEIAKAIRSLPTKQEGGE